MQLNLVPHPSAPPGDPAFKVWATIDHASALGSVATTNIWFGVAAPAKRFVSPATDDPGRADELWKSTCFELFLRDSESGAYREWNFAPSGDWAAYDFDDYRSAMAPADVPEPYVRTEDNLTWWALGATIAVESDRPWQLGLSAVLEEQDGTKSYWALAHPDGEKPDFHAADCFTAQLP